jgi:hypothetical protein
LNNFEEDDERTIYILDEHTVINQLDIIENCSKLKNIVFMQTIVESFKKK